MNDHTNTNEAQSKKPRAKKPYKITVADYIARQLEVCGKSQAQVAQEVGWTQNNMVSLLKSGKTKLALHRVKPLAKALRVDPQNLLMLSIEEYFPQVFEVMEELVNQPVLTANEQEIIRLTRSIDPNDPRIHTKAQEDAYRQFVLSLRTDEERKSIERLEQLNEEAAEKELLKQKAKIEAKLQAGKGE